MKPSVTFTGPVGIGVNHGTATQTQYNGPVAQAIGVNQGGVTQTQHVGSHDAAAAAWAVFLRQMRIVLPELGLGEQDTAEAEQILVGIEAEKDQPQHDHKRLRALLKRLGSIASKSTDQAAIQLAVNTIEQAVKDLWH
jgi:hypothetical protein